MTLKEFESKVQSAISDRGPDDPEGDQIWVQVDDDTFTDCLRLEGCEIRAVAEIAGEELFTIEGEEGVDGERP